MQTVTTTPLLLTYDEAAELLNMSRDSLRREVKRGRIRVLHPRSGCPRFAPEDLEEYIWNLRNPEETTHPKFINPF